MDDYFDRIDTFEDYELYIDDDCLPLEDEPVVSEPDYPIHSYEDNCPACGGDRCYYADTIPQGFCEYHGHYDLLAEEGNCPSCLAEACDRQAGAYVDSDWITCWE